MPTTTEPGTWRSRLLWFVALWTAGVLVVAAAAYTLRWLFRVI